MSLILTLIANPKVLGGLDAETLAGLAAFLPGAGAVKWLSPGAAAEIPLAVDGAEARAVEAAVRSQLAGRPVDVAVLPAANRRKKLLVADMDSTIIEQECIDELADYVGRKAEVSAITERAMLGELPFEAALRERAVLLKGLPASAIDEILAERITIMPGAEVLVATMRANGALTALVSGGFTAFTRPVAERVGFDEQYANILVIEDGLLAGRSEEPVRGREAKLEALLSLRDRLGLVAAETLAVGDGANDLSMIEAAGLGVAYHAKPAVAAAADARIDHGDLTALLYLQGYSDGEFAG